MSKLLNSPKIVVPEKARAAAREAIGNYFQHCGKLRYHNYTAIGMGEHSLARVFGVDAYTWHSVLLVAGLATFRKNGKSYILSSTQGMWKNLIADEGLDNEEVKVTQDRVALLVLDEKGKPLLDKESKEIALRAARDQTLIKLLEKTEEGRSIKVLIDDLGAKIKDNRYASPADKASDRNEKKRLEEKKKEVSQKVKDYQKTKKSQNERLEKFRKSRSYDPYSTISKILKMLKEKQIKREDYFERKFNGVNICRIMNDSQSIFDEIIPILLADKRGGDDALTDDEVTAKCRDYQKLFELIDVAMKGLSTRFPHPTESNVDGMSLADTKKAIQMAVDKAKEMGLSITPRWHIFSAHAYNQHERLVREGWGGLFILDESFIELSHQAGVRLELQLRGLKMFEQKHNAAFKIAHRNSNPNVSKLLDKNREQKKRKATITDEKKKAKKEKRTSSIS